MTNEEIARFHAKRVELFPVHLPQRVVDAITGQLAARHYERAIAALERYADEKPFRGFYLARFNHHYDLATPSLPRRESGRSTAPLPAAVNAGEDWRDSERKAFEAVPADYVAQCRVWFRDWPWPENSRAWRILVVDSYAGRDIDRFRCLAHPSKRAENLEERFRAIWVERERVGWHNLVARLRQEIVNLGGDPNVVEEGLTLVRDRPGGSLGTFDPPKDGRPLGPFRLYDATRNDELPAALVLASTVPDVQHDGE